MVFPFPASGACRSETGPPPSVGALYNLGLEPSSCSDEKTTVSPSGLITKSPEGPPCGVEARIVTGGELPSTGTL